ncbi:MAG TPA: OsmC family protein [Longimicrobiaceae bacterium]|nr:OsmC family protein [Longimicrobiaceae bacterium]
MGVEMSGAYTGGLKMRLTHGPSGTEIGTAAPVDNRGDGSSFSPTDLLAASLGSCMVTTMAIVAEREGIPFSQARFTLEKHMRSDPRRVDRIPVTVHMPGGLDAAQRERLEAAARGCPVHRSLAPEVAREVSFVYPD